jgi:hypothetical protein
MGNKDTTLAVNDVPVRGEIWVVISCNQDKLSVMVTAERLEEFEFSYRRFTVWLHMKFSAVTVDNKRTCGLNNWKKAFCSRYPLWGAQMKITDDNDGSRHESACTIRYV